MKKNKISIRSSVAEYLTDVVFGGDQQDSIEMHYEDDNTHDELLPIKKKCGLIVTGNATTMHIKMGGGAAFKNTSKMISMMLGSCETLYACDTYQFNDYSKYYAGMWDEKHKAEHRDKQFPIDLQNAYELGKRLCE